MIGFVNTEKEKRVLGGAVVQHQRKMKKIGWSIAGIITFVILNVILYFLSKI